MPLNEGDVLNALSDAVTLNMDFWVGSVHISGKPYSAIRDHIRAGNILVKIGNGVLAEYDGKTDILTTQAGNSPANVFQRAQLLHECTHALVDIFNQGSNLSRHVDELASYIAQFVFTMRLAPAAVVGPANNPWENFYRSVEALVKRFHLETLAGNGSRIGIVDLEPLRILLAALPNVNYGNFTKDDPSGADGLIRNNLFLEAHEEVTAHKMIAHETYPDPSDETLIRTLQEQYAKSDVAGYGKRLRSLRQDFALCSLGRAKALYPRLIAKIPSDRLSVLFHDRLSTEGRAILVRVLRKRK